MFPPRRDSMDSLLGRTLSHYKILDEISRGGMGIVYRALDVKLNREVALKVLPPELVSDPERKRRFIQEAQAAAALHHPHIATVFEIDEVDETTFIAMERIKGERLQEILSRGPLRVVRAVELSTEIVEGLVRAHQKGIVHRDLKPSNLMVTEEGHAKIIDFGLAKLVEPLEPLVDSQADTALRGGTESGVVMGTVSYMSPEQAKAKRVDHRTDIFSFGIVFYEMLTGKNPFERESAAETLSAILKESPSALAAAMQDVVKLQRVVDKCLAKAPEERYQATQDLLLDLKWIRRDSEVSAPTDLRPRAMTRLALGASMVFALLLGGLLYFLRFRDEPVPELINPVQVTRSLGGEGAPSWSPEGGRLAYHLRNLTSGWDIWVAQVAGGQAVNLTQDPAEAQDYFPSWSPDGSQIAFFSFREGGGCFVMSALGGPARKVGESMTSGSKSAWSSNGSELACVVGDKDTFFVQMISLASGESRRLPLPGRAFGRRELSWSPDGRYFAYLDGGPTDPVLALRVLRIEDGKTFDVTDGRSQVYSPMWSADGRYLYFVSNRVGTTDLWRQRMREGQSPGEPERVTAGVRMRTAAFSSDGKKLAYSTAGRVSNVFRVPILKDRPATWADAQQITFDEGALIEQVDVSPDESRLLVSSDRAGNFDIWMLPSEGGAMQPVTTDPTPDWAPAWSPNGKEITFYAYRSGGREIWAQPVLGGPARQLTKGEWDNKYPTWSADGESLLFDSMRGGKDVTWIVSASGGEPRQLMTESFGARSSPDGKWLAFVSERSGRRAIWRARADGGEPECLVETSAVFLRWSRDGNWIYYLADDIKAVRADGSGERPMTDFRGRRGFLSEGMAADGKYLYFSWWDDRGDIWVTDVAYR